MNQSDFLSIYRDLPVGATLDLHGAEVAVDDEIVLRHGKTVRDARFTHTSPDTRLTVKQQGDGQGHQRAVLDGCRVVGFEQQGIGLIVQVPNVRLREVYIQNASRGLELRNLAFLFAAEGCVFKGNNKGVFIDAEKYMRGKGENISFHHCSISGNQEDGFVLKRARVSLFACSIDYNLRHGAIMWGGSEVKSVCSHWETEKGREHIHDADGAGNTWTDVHSRILEIKHA